MRIEGRILGFDEYMNLVVDDAEEIMVKKKTRRAIGRILLKGDNICLMMSTGVGESGSGGVCSRDYRGFLEALRKGPTRSPGGPQGDRQEAPRKGSGGPLAAPRASHRDIERNISYIAQCSAHAAPMPRLVANSGEAPPGPTRPREAPRSSAARRRGGRPRGVWWGPCEAPRPPAGPREAPPGLARPRRALRCIVRPREAPRGPRRSHEAPRGSALSQTRLVRQRLRPLARARVARHASRMPGEGSMRWSSLARNWLPGGRLREFLPGVDPRASRLSGPNTQERGSSRTASLKLGAQASDIEEYGRHGAARDAASAPSRQPALVAPMSKSAPLARPLRSKVASRGSGRRSLGVVGPLRCLLPS